MPTSNTRSASRKPPAETKDPWDEETPKTARQTRESQPAQDNPRTPGSLSGNLTADPDLRFTQTGLAVCNLRVAVNEREKIDGEWVDKDPEFYTVTVWRDQAERCAEHLQRGMRIVATGYFEDHEYENRDGDTVTETRFTANDIGPSMLMNEVRVRRVQRSKA
jgi:single-strand DNA-binding protein